MDVVLLKKTMSTNVNNRRIVILIGAGSATPWGGLITSSLTDFVIKHCTYKNKSNQNYLAYLQEIIFNTTIHGNSDKHSDVNFEVLIEAICFLHQYYSKSRKIEPFEINHIPFEPVKIAELIKDELPEIIYLDEYPK